MTLEVFVKERSKLRPMIVSLKKQENESWVTLGLSKKWNKEIEIYCFFNRIRHKKLTFRNVIKNCNSILAPDSSIWPYITYSLVYKKEI